MKVRPTKTPPAPALMRSGAERFVDAGVSVGRVRADLQKGLPITTSSFGVDPHFGLGARRAVSANNDLGVRVEFDEVDGHALIAVRAIDYLYRVSNHLALGLFAGAARYDVATPAYAVYFGAGAIWRNILPKWDLGVDLRHVQNAARDHVLASDPLGARPDSFYKIDTALLYLSRRF